jgi:phosphoglycolate phosphatase
MRPMRKGEILRPLADGVGLRGKLKLEARGRASKSAMAKFKDILFDLDGTLTDPGDGIVRTIRHALYELGAAPPAGDDLRWAVGPPLREIFVRLLEPYRKADLAERAAAIYLAAYAAQGAAESAPYRGVEPMLKELRDSARLYVVTSKNTATAERILGMCALRRYFVGVIGNGRLSDKSAMVRDLIERERIEPNAAAIVGDRAHDVAAGRGNGLFTIGVGWGYGSPGELEAAGAQRICSTPAELADFLLER